MNEEMLAAAGLKARGWRDGENGILRFCQDNFGVELDTWQEKTLRLVQSPKREHRRIAMKACIGPGKSAVLAMAGWWFLVTQAEDYEHPKGLVTAITSDNLKGNLWSEYSKWQQRSEFLTLAFEWTAGAIFRKGKHAPTWRIEARSWPKTASPEQQGQTFSGLHAKRVLVQCDESGNMPTPILRAADQALVRCVFGKVMQAGNPTALVGYMLYDACTLLRDQWVIVTVTGDPDDADAWVHSPRVGDDPKAYSIEQIRMYGRDNPWVKSQILGQFPPSGLNTLLSLEDCETAIARKPRPEDYDFVRRKLGVDVARFGDDRTVIFPRQGAFCYQPIVMRGARTTDIAARVSRVNHQWADGRALIFVDDTGHWGHGVIDQLTVANIPAIPLVYHAKATHPRYKNRRAEMWIKMADAVKAGARLPNDAELIRELTAVTYMFSQGQFQLEEKDQVKKRIGSSPDKGDALAQTYALDDEPDDGTNGGGRARTHDDPDGRDTSRARAGRAVTQDDLEG